MQEREEQVVLVNEKDEQTGLAGKTEAHAKGLLHRAFSVFVFNERGELLLQQRAAHKYHSPLQWANTCCSHPREGEDLIDAGKRRLKEEMGFSCELEKKFHFIYKASFDNGLIEHELDHVLVGYASVRPDINPDEVHDFKWMPLDEVVKDIEVRPEVYTPWFKIILKEYLESLS